MSDLRPMVKVGQAYASTSKADVRNGERQRRYVERVDNAYVWLRTESYPGTSPLSRIRFRDDITSQSIPGHRLVRDVS